MFTPIQLEAIKMFGRKDLTEGCWINLRDEDDYDGDGHICKLTQPNEYDEKGWYLICPHTPYGYTDSIHIEKDNDSIYEILGHIPHLEDLFRVAEGKMYMVWIDNSNKKITIVGDCDECDKGPKEIKYSPTLPLLEQPNLEEIINIFK